MYEALFIHWHARGTTKKSCRIILAPFLKLTIFPPVRAEFFFVASLIGNFYADACIIFIAYNNFSAMRMCARRIVLPFIYGTFTK